jgi:hypothetical protein
MSRETTLFASYSVISTAQAQDGIFRDMDDELGLEKRDFGFFQQIMLEMLRSSPPCKSLFADYGVLRKRLGLSLTQLRMVWKTLAKSWRLIRSRAIIHATSWPPTRG